MSRPPRLTALLSTAALAGLLVLSACSGEEPAAETKQDIALSVLPGIAQPGPKPAAADEAAGVLTARVSPAEAGREVSLEVQVGEGDDVEWAELETGETNAGGTADFILDDEPAGATYRVIAESTDNLPELTSPKLATPSAAPAFSDEFAGRKLDLTTWYHRGADYNPEGLRVCSRGAAEAARVAGGTLQLSVILDAARAGEKCRAKKANGKSLGDFDYRLNGHVASHATFTYGVSAARIKFQRERGQHGSFWLQSTTSGPTSAAEAGAEIDVVEYFGEDETDRLASFIHYPTPDGPAKEGDWIENASDFLADQDASWWEAYHVFAVEWDEDEYVIRIDGQEAWRTDQGVSEQPEFIVLSLLSSDYELPGLPSTDLLPATMQVDWVRHWAPTA